MTEKVEAGSAILCRKMKLNCLKIEMGERSIDLGGRYMYPLIGNTVVILLCAGDKSTQPKDIGRAVEYLRDFKGRN